MGVFKNYFAYLNKNPYLCTIYGECSSMQVIQRVETLAETGAEGPQNASASPRVIGSFLAKVLRSNFLFCFIAE